MEQGACLQLHSEGLRCEEWSDVSASALRGSAGQSWSRGIPCRAVRRRESRRRLLHNEGCAHAMPRRVRPPSPRQRRNSAARAFCACADAHGVCAQCYLPPGRRGGRVCVRAATTTADKQMDKRKTVIFKFHLYSTLQVCHIYIYYINIYTRNYT